MNIQHPVLDWPHAPVHRFLDRGTFMVTSGTYRKLPLFNSADRLNYLVAALLALSSEYNWRMHAWAVFPNHYHFIADTQQPETLKCFLQYLHSISAKFVNRLDNVQGRKISFQYWDSHLTYQRSLLTRLNYVHSNAVHHGLVRLPEDYPWCSASWLQRKASAAFYSTVMRFPSNRIAVPDDYQVRLPDA